jgi:hypothetical protein
MDTRCTPDGGGGGAELMTERMRGARQGVGVKYAEGCGRGGGGGEEGGGLEEGREEGGAALDLAMLTTCHRL